MNLEFILAKRYLLAKKSQNIINIISMISLCGISVITMALICTLSVFNGFQDLVSGLFSSFDPELKIEIVKGKTFDIGLDKVQTVKNMPELAVFSEVLEENALLSYYDRQIPAIVKGVEENYNQLASIESIIRSGEFKLNDGVADYATIGGGLAYHLGINAGFVKPMEVYFPKKEAKINVADPSNAFSTGMLFAGATFIVDQQKYDDNMVIAPLKWVRKMLNSEGQVSAIELKIRDGANIEIVKKRIADVMGPDFTVLNRMEQQKESFRIMQIEKWISFLIIIFILLIASFNVIGSLSMLIIDKKQDIMTLRNLGADEHFIKKVFFMEGWLISLTGTVIGIGVGIILCLLQQYLGFIKLGGTAGMFIIDSYPVKLEFQDILWVVISVTSISFI